MVKRDVNEAGAAQRRGDEAQIVETVSIQWQPEIYRAGIRKDGLKEAEVSSGVCLRIPRIDDGVVAYRRVRGSIRPGQQKEAFL